MTFPFSGECVFDVCLFLYLAVEDGGCRARPDFHPTVSCSCSASLLSVPLSCFLLLSGAFTVLADAISHPGSPDRLFNHQPSAATSLSAGRGRKQPPPQPVPRDPGVAPRVRYVQLVSVGGRRPPPNMRALSVKCAGRA